MSTCLFPPPYNGLLVLASAHGWVEAIRKGWDGAEQLAGAERDGGSEDLRGGQANAKRRRVRGAGAEDRVLGCLCWTGAVA